MPTPDATEVKNFNLAMERMEHLISPDQVRAILGEPHTAVPLLAEEFTGPLAMYLRDQHECRKRGAHMTVWIYRFKLLPRAAYYAVFDENRVVLFGKLTWRTDGGLAFRPTTSS